MPTSKHVLSSLLVLGLLCSIFPVAAEAPYLVRQPAVNETHIVFVFADDLWIVPREGGQARRLTTGEGAETWPAFSPDGQTIAFSGNYDGNTDVYVVPAAGGVPERLTFHPGNDTVNGWTPDGSVMFTSERISTSGYGRLFTIAVHGGLPRPLPVPIAFRGAISADGRRLAYDPRAGAYQTWKRYRGGLMSRIWVADLRDSSVVEVPSENSNDFNPMWHGDRVYFLSDRSGSMTLYSWDQITGQVRLEIPHRGLDLKSASAGPGVIVYEQFGSIHLFDVQSRQSTQVPIEINADLLQVRPRFENVSGQIRNAHLSPTGKRAVFEARGEILTVPAKKGHVRNLTRTPGVAERDPAWSPDGKWIAYFSDTSGEYELHLADQTGLMPVRKIALSDAPSFFYSPIWSPDSEYLAYTDKALNLWLLDVDEEQTTRVDKTAYRLPVQNMNPRFSPDSRWLTYSKQLENHVHVAMVYDIEKERATQVTDGLSDVRHPVFDRNGKYLYFTASTDIGPTLGWGEMSSLSRPVTRSAYVMVLSKEDPSPLAPESDDEDISSEKNAKDESSDAKNKNSEEKIRIDFEGLDQRILALPVPAQNIVGLAAGEKGELYIATRDPLSRNLFGGGELTVHEFTWKERKAKPFVEGTHAFVQSADAKQALILRGGNWAIVSTANKPKPGTGKLDLSEMHVRVDPKAEWEQIYRETWRIERDFLYDPNAHGLDLERAEKTYEPFLENLAARNDLNYLVSEMLGNLVLGHTRNVGGDIPEPERVAVGLLGADYSTEDGRYRFERIYHGENWNPDLRAPLTEPGVDVNEGDFLLSVDGRSLRDSDNVYALFENKAGRPVQIEVSSSSDGSGSRTTTIVPIENESSLRHRAWIDENRRKVDEMTGGRVGYVYLPNTSVAGFTNFNRYYYAQTGKQAMVIDERFNGGGLFANWIVDQMKRPLINYWEIRDSHTMATPAGQVFGPKVMIINEFAGSGGDWMPWYFRRAGVGQLVGKRTWGGLVGIYGFPTLIDGGAVTAPNLAFWTPEGEWLIENVGVAPDIDVEFDPQAWRQGRDVQLERAVEIVLEELERNPVPTHTPPPYPNYYEDRPQPSR